MMKEVTYLLACTMDEVMVQFDGKIPIKVYCYHDSLIIVNKMKNIIGDIFDKVDGLTWKPHPSNSLFCIASDPVKALAFIKRQGWTRFKE